VPLEKTDLSDILRRLEVLEKKLEKLSLKDTNPTKSKKNQIFEIEQNMPLWSQKFPGIDIGEELEKMLDWLKANNKRKKDYKAFFRNWLRKASAGLSKSVSLEDKIKYIFGCPESECQTIESPYKDMYYFCSTCKKQKIVINKKR
jgi:hypothetical protein